MSFDELLILNEGLAYHPKGHSRITVLDSAIARHNLGLVRDKNTEPRQFTDSMQVISSLLFAEATKNLGEGKKAIITPNAPMMAREIVQTVGVAVILRAAIGFAEPWIESFRNSNIPVSVVHVDMHRDESTKLPILSNPIHLSPSLAASKDRKIYVMDPMNATGGTSTATCTFLKEQYPGVSISLINLIGAPGGLDLFTATHPDIPVFLAAIDPLLNEFAYIVPGLGDAGDRQFGTS